MMALLKILLGFVRNYNMHNMGKTIGEIHAMLIEYEKGLPKKAETPQVMMIRDGKIQKANKKSLKAKGKNKVNGKGKDKKVYIPKPNNPKPTAKERPAKDDACHHCKEVGHWKRNCHVYLAELQKKRKQVGSAILQGFRIERKLKQGALYLYVGNGVRAQVEAIGSFDLVLPNGLFLMTRNLASLPYATRWNEFLPSKVKIHPWRVTNGRITTRANLDRHRIHLDSIHCPVCNEHTESDQDHVFVGVGVETWKVVLDCCHLGNATLRNHAIEC
ncbi:zinc finger, CCHC-type containing protein [Tanacetum coccineum]